MLVKVERSSDISYQVTVISSINSYCICLNYTGLIEYLLSKNAIKGLTCIDSKLKIKKNKKIFGKKKCFLMLSV